MEDIILKIDQIIRKANSAFFFCNKCSNVASTLQDNKKQMKILESKDLNQKEITELQKILDNLLKKIEKIQDKQTFWLYLNEKKQIQKLVNGINKCMKKVNSILKDLGVKNLTELPISSLFDDYAKIDDFLANSQILINEKRNEVNEYLKQNHSQFTEPIFETVDKENINELNKSGKKVDKSDFIQENEVAYENNVFTYYLGKDKRDDNNKDVTILKLKNEYKGIYKRLVSVLLRIDHPYVESFVGSYIENSEVTIITNRCGKSLSSYLSHHTNHDTFSFKPGDRTILAFKIAEGMSYLHSRRIIHRNLINSSIYIIPSDDPNAEILPMIAGFRDSRFLNKGRSYGYTSKDINTLDYKMRPFFAPEHDDNHTYDEKVDVFSFSGILFELVTNCAPFSCFDSDKIRNVKSAMKAGARPNIPPNENISDDLIKLIKLCWANDPKDRISFDEIIDMMIEKNIVFPFDKPNEKVVLDFYARKRIKSYSAQKCIEQFMTIKKDIGRAFQYRFELLRVRPILHNYQYLLRESEYAKIEFLDNEIEDKMEQLSDNLDHLSSIVSDSLEDNWIDKLERIKIYEITDGINKYMKEIYESMLNLGFSNIPEYKELEDDLIFDYREIENFFNDSIDKTNFFIDNKRLDQNTIQLYRIKIAEVKQFRSDRKLDKESSKALNERIKDLLSPFQSYELNCCDYEIDRQQPIKSTFISEVYKGKAKNKKFVAIKVIKEEHLQKGENQLIYLRREIGYLTRLKHKYIAKFIGYALPKDKNEIWLISKFYEDGTLHERLRLQDPKRVNEMTLKPIDKTKIAFKIAEIMNCLHSNKILHLDLKSSNILMKGKTPKLIDFGFSCSDNDALKIKNCNIGTYTYMAPEILKNQNYDSKADVFSYGMLLWEIYYDQAPYESDSDDDLIKRKITDNIELDFNKKIQDRLKNLIKSCYVSIPSLRPSFAKIIHDMMTIPLYFEGTSIKDISMFYDKKSEKLKMNVT